MDKQEYCPFCGNTGKEEFAIEKEQRLEGTLGEYTSYRASCSCGATGPDADNPEKAVELWNKRFSSKPFSINKEKIAEIWDAIGKDHEPPYSREAVILAMEKLNAARPPHTPSTMDFIIMRQFGIFIAGYEIGTRELKHD